MTTRYALSWGGVGDEIHIVATKDDEIPMDESPEVATEMARVLAQKTGREIRVVKISEVALVQPARILIEDATHRAPLSEDKVS